MSWLVAFGVVNMRNQFIRMVVDILYRLTEPLLRPIRRILPNLGGVDISPVILLLGLFFMRRPLHDYVWPVLSTEAAADPAFLRRTGAGVTVDLRAQPRARRCAARAAPRTARSRPR